MKRVLVVEDEASIREMVALNLKMAGWEVVEAPSAERALELMHHGEECDAALLDIMLPGMDGLSLCETIRRENNEIGIIIVSAKGQESDKIRGLSIGADDYITKPFGSSELLARIRTSLRHSTRMNTSSDQLFHPYKCGELILDFEKRTLTISGNIVHLTPIEYKILVFLAQNCGKVMTYSSIINNVWGPYADDNNRILRVNMTNIRRKIEKNPADPQYIFTEVGVGYRMSEEHC